MEKQALGASLKAAALASILSVLMLPGCGDSEKCTSQAHTYCDEGVTYWIDSCGDLEDVKEYCGCGCKPDHSSCLECECKCSQASDCCDGCLPINENSICDDGDASTINDICYADGSCAGWNHEVAPPESPAELAQPEPVRLRSWTCPEGWLSVEHDELLDENGDPLSWCEPPPLPRLKLEDYITPLAEGEQEGDRPICEPAVDGTYPVLGHTTCQPLGDPCPAGEWPEIPADVTGNRIHVRAGAVGGDGTQAAPFGTIADAVAASASGDVVVLAAGVYAESVSIAKDLTLWGSCVQQSAIDAPGPHAGAEAGAVEVVGGTDVRIRNLRISGSQNGVWVNSQATTVSVRGVWIHRATRQGISADAGDSSLMQVLVDSTLPDDDGIRGRGLLVWHGAQVQAESTTFERNRDGGVLVIDSDTRLSLGEVAIVNTQSRESDLTSGRGLEANGGAQVTVTRGLLQGNREVGIIATNSGTLIALEDVAVQNTQCQEAGLVFGTGLLAQEGSQVTLTRGLFRGNREVGIAAIQNGTLVSLDDVVVLNTRSQEAGLKFGKGLEAGLGAQVTLRRGLFQGNRDVGVDAFNSGTRLSLEDVAVLDTRSREVDLSLGWGLGALEGAQLTLTRGLFKRNRDTGILASDSGTVMSLEDVEVLNTQNQEADLLYGRGLHAESGAQVTLTRGLFQENRNIGIIGFDSGTLLTLEDVAVLNTQSQASDLMGGRGLGVHAGAQAEVTRGLFQGNREVGISVVGSGTLVSLVDVTVLDTRSQEADLTYGWGLGVQQGAQLTLSRGLFQGNREVGIVALNSDTLVSLEDVAILDTQSREADLTFGRGLIAQEGVEVTLTRGLVQGNREVGIIAYDNGTLLSLEDVAVLDTHSQEVDFMLGRGMHAQDGARVTLTRGLVQGNRDFGISAAHSGTLVSLNQVIVTETLKQECAALPDTDPLSCAGYGAGTGLATVLEASFSVAGVEVSDSSLAGLMIARLGSASGQGLTIRENPIGVNIQEVPEGYDFFGAVAGLWVEDNQVNFDSSNLPVPDPVEIFEE